MSHASDCRQVNKAACLLILAVIWSAGCNGQANTSADKRGAETPPAGVSGADNGQSTAESSQGKGKGAGGGIRKSSDRATAGPPKIVPQFPNVAAQSGVDFTFFNDSVPDRYFLPEIMGGGAAWLDYDGDGWPDLYLANGCQLKDPDPKQTQHVSRLFRNLGGGQFVEVTLPARGWHNGFGQGLAVGDYDADGFPDLFYSCYGADVLLHNLGDGTFENVTEAAGVSDPEWSSSSVWFDADADGDLDLYVINYLEMSFEDYRICYYSNRPGYCGPSEYNAEPDRLYLNQGDGTFVESLDALGMTAADGKGLAIAVIDMDQDLKPEIYVANDMAPNFLFTRGAALGEARQKRQQASGESAATKLYDEVGMLAGCAVSDMGVNEASMGISIADFDGDGLPDIYLTHFIHAKNTFYRNQGGLTFIDDSYRTRVAATSFGSLGFGTVPIDYDRDGVADIFIANGHVQGPKVQPYEMNPQLLRNDGRARFDNIGQFAGNYFTDTWVGRSAAACDYDRDGDLDIAVTHLHRPVALLRNDTQTQRHWIGLELRTLNRVPPVGGRVRIASALGEHTVPIQAGGSYLASPDPRLQFSAGDGSRPASVEIYWPSGRVQKLDELPLDRYWIVYEDQTPLEDPVLTEGQTE